MSFVYSSPESPLLVVLSSRTVVLPTGHIAHRRMRMGGNGYFLCMGLPGYTAQSYNSHSWNSTLSYKRPMRNKYHKIQANPSDAKNRSILLWI